VKTLLGQCRVRRGRSNQQRLTILLELELNIFLNNYLNRRIKDFPGEDTAGAGQGETLPIPFQQRLTIMDAMEYYHTR